MNARLQKEGIRLDLTAPFGETDPVRGVLLAALAGKRYPLSCLHTHTNI